MVLCSSSIMVLGFSRDLIPCVSWHEDLQTNSTHCMQIISKSRFQFPHWVMKNVLSQYSNLFTFSGLKWNKLFVDFSLPTSSTFYCVRVFGIFFNFSIVVLRTKLNPVVVWWKPCLSDHKAARTFYVSQEREIVERVVWRKTKWSFPLVWSRWGAGEGKRVSETAESRAKNTSKKYDRNWQRKNKRKKTRKKKMTVSPSKSSWKQRAKSARR